jgi:alpha-ketoglutarate-dependent taurine dioxygenase
MSSKVELGNISDVSLVYLKPFGVMLVTESKKMQLLAISADLIQVLLKANKLVILRGFSAIEKSALVEYAKSFGTLLEWDFGNVMEMRVHQEPKNYLFTEGHVPLHWDGAFHQEPKFLLFNCIVAPRKNNGGETIFANTEMLVDDLSDDEVADLMQHRITYETEKVVHYGGKITVPVIQHHPFSHNKIIRFAEPVKHGLNPVTANVENISLPDSDKLISSLKDKLYESQYCYSHEWENNDFLIADNFSLLHGRNAFNQFSERHLRRIQIL